jgi:CubicO group peptidase (beta-lactamase class C family)
MRKLLVLLLAAAAVPLFAADKPTPTREQALALVRAWIDAEQHYEQIPGLSVAVVHDQDLVWEGGFGTSTPQTIYSICSISKLFTSIGVMQLRDEGKLRLDDPLSTYLKWFTPRPANGAAEPTLRGILTHSAGLTREADAPYWSPPDFNFPTREQLVEKLANEPLLYPAGTYFQYSNLGLALAGEVIRSVSGQPYDVYVQQHILTPLHLDSTTPEMPEAERGKRLAVGYSAKRRDGTRAALPFFQARGIAPAAGYASTVEDLARFAEWQFHLLDSNGIDILRAGTLREMQRPNFVDPDFETFRGLGFAINRRDGKTFVGHQGVCPGYRSSLVLQNDDKIAVVVMANANGADVGTYAGRIHDIVAPALASKGTPKPHDPSLDAFAGSYDAFPWDGEEIVVPWGDGLGIIGAPTTNPLKALDFYRKTGERTFRRVRDDGTLGETITFELGPDGKVDRLVQFSQVERKMK